MAMHLSDDRQALFKKVETLTDGMPKPISTKWWLLIGNSLMYRLDDCKADMKGGNGNDGYNGKGDFLGGNAVVAHHLSLANL